MRCDLAREARGDRCLVADDAPLSPEVPPVSPELPPVPPEVDPPSSAVSSRHVEPSPRRPKGLLVRPRVDLEARRRPWSGFVGTPGQREDAPRHIAETRRRTEVTPVIREVAPVVGKDTSPVPVVTARKGENPVRPSERPFGDREHPPAPRKRCRFLRTRRCAGTRQHLPQPTTSASSPPRTPPRPPARPRSSRTVLVLVLALVPVPRQVRTLPRLLVIESPPPPRVDPPPPPD